MPRRPFVRFCGITGCVILTAIGIAAIIAMSEMIMTRENTSWWMFPLLGIAWLGSFPLIFAGKRGN